MPWEPILWLISFVANMLLIGSNLYQIICLSDLEADHMNPYESSSRINAVVVPEFILHGGFCILFLMTGHWFFFLLTLPLAYFNAKKYMARQHLVDVTEVFRFLDAEKKTRIVKLAFYLIIFVLVIIRLIFAVINSVFDEDEAIHLFNLF